MPITTDDLAAIAESVVAAPSDLLTTANPKTAKGEKLGYLTAVLHLAPAMASGFEMCGGERNRTVGCTIACLNTAGRGAFDEAIQRARIRKSKWCRADRQAFMVQLEKDIRRHIREAARHGLLPAVRLNGTSDLPWEKVRYLNAAGDRVTIFETFPEIQFYDYTKVAARFGKTLPANYDLTFSVADGNERAEAFAVARGARTATVYRNAANPKAEARRWDLPATAPDGGALVDADRHDLRFLDPPGARCGLKAKGAARFDTTGFVRDIQPA